MHIRRATTEEAESLWQIRNVAIRHGCQGVYAPEVIAAWTPDTMPEGYRSEVARFPFYVAVDANNQPVASGYLDLGARSIEAIFTLPQWGGKGLATQIIAVLKEEARQRDFTRLTLSATPNACTFYQKRGFTVIQEAFHRSAMAKSDLRCFEMVCEL
ncbi:GNAT family N-acetyltransferase [Kosakonia sp.]|uniref:GNAT family N-acetyltransferase n=1 Tax=Kosakonia sp. TaxID=1916651 RepID=UPI0028A29609|nr:GNAT family N-acetyltransferase [Kosakonia sp.]